MSVPRACGVIGCAVVPFRGRVLAAFPRAAHVEAGEGIVTLGDPGLPAHPYTLAWPGWAGAAPAAGDAVELLGDALTVGRTRTALGPLRRFTPRRASPRWAGRVALARALGETRRAAAGLQGRGGLHAWVSGTRGGDAWSRALLRTCAPHIAAAGAAVRARDWAALAVATAGLAGLGPGLTPSGDDFCAGLLAAVRYHGATAGRPAPQEALDAAAEGVAARTAAYAGFHVRCAARGLVSEPVERWLSAVHAGARTIAERTAAVAAMGHSSGVDALAGLLCGLEAAEGWSA